jgi:quercetin dioxygenase-like cupin family protein
MSPSARVILAGIAAALLQAPLLSAQEVSYQNLVEPVLSSGETVVGETIVYPAGAPARITAVIVTVPPGGETDWHVHPVPLFGYVLEGELTVDYGDRGRRTYRAGEGLLEAMATRHNGLNAGPAPVRLLAVYLGAEGRANAVAAQTPENSAATPQ